jgi:hypothetical protein
MNKQKFYDVYVSYPPGENRERINDCLRDNLPENEAEDLIQALAERSQAIIAENCSQDERENAQHYFNYLGLDVIVRQSMELTPNAKNEEEETTNKLHQCPVCRTIIDDQEATECLVCHFHFSTANEATIQRKRIEWEEKLAFEHKRQAEIEQKIQQEKEREEKLMRRQIRAELEEKLREELAQNPNIAALDHQKRKTFLTGVFAAIGIFALMAIGYIAAKYL